MTATDASYSDARYTRVLGEWLARPDVRISRALKSMEWVTAEVIFAAVTDDPLEFPMCAKALARLVKSGHVLRRGDPAVFRLEVELPVPRPAQSDAPAKPGTEGEERPGWFFWRGSWRRA